MHTNSKLQQEATVFVSGLFNVLHPGHFRFLKFASEQGDKLVVGVLPDSKAPEATVSQKERLANLKAISFIDEAIILDQLPKEYVLAHKPNVVVKGWEHYGQDNPEKEILNGYGGRLIFSSGDIKLSGLVSPGTVNPDAALYSISKPSGYFKRHKLKAKSIQKTIKKFSKLSVCVLGDIIVDNYLDCQPVGMSREDPTIVVRPAGHAMFLGGAGIVAAHAKGLGADVHFLSVSGEDEAGEYARGKLDEIGVKHHIVKDSSRPTTQKTRYRAGGKTLLRVNDYVDHPIANGVRDSIISNLEKLVDKIDLIIFSDFSYGALPQELVDKITHFAESNAITICADSQSSSQIGDVSRFKNLELITPTEHEARLALNNFSDGLVQLAEKIQTKVNAKNVIITLAEEGIFLAKEQTSVEENGLILNDRLPALQLSLIHI